MKIEQLSWKNKVFLSCLINAWQMNGEGSAEAWFSVTDVWLKKQLQMPHYWTKKSFYELSASGFIETKASASYPPQRLVQIQWDMLFNLMEEKIVHE